MNRTLFMVRVNASGYLSRDEESGYLGVSWCGSLYSTESQARRDMNEFLGFVPGAKLNIETREFK